MQQPGHRDRSARRSGERVLVTDTVVLTESDTAGPREGDVVHGLRVGLALSAAFWLGMVLLGMLIFG